MNHMDLENQILAWLESHRKETEEWKILLKDSVSMILW